MHTLILKKRHRQIFEDKKKLQSSFMYFRYLYIENRIPYLIYLFNFLGANWSDDLISAKIENDTKMVPKK